jgi:putative DNA primase/helicase
MVGVGSNGKGVLTAAIERTLGAYAAPAPPNLLTGANASERHSTEIANLLGCRLVTSSENEDGAMLRESFVKLITGGDMLKARYMRCDFFQFKPTFKLQLLTNHLPQIRGTEFAIWRRTLIVRFSVRFGTDEDIREGIADRMRDDTLQTALASECEGILAWIVTGASEWYRDGLRPPESVLVAVRQHQSDQDRVSVFVADNCTLGADERVAVSDLYASYVSWSKSSGTIPQSRIRFVEEITRVAPAAHKATVNTGPKSNRSRHQIMEGLGLLDFVGGVG